MVCVCQLKFRICLLTHTDNAVISIAGLWNNCCECHVYDREVHTKLQNIIWLCTFTDVTSTLVPKTIHKGQTPRPRHKIPRSRYQASRLTARPRHQMKINIVYMISAPFFSIQFRFHVYEWQHFRARFCGLYGVFTQKHTLHYCAWRCRFCFEVVFLSLIQFAAVL